MPPANPLKGKPFNVHAHCFTIKHVPEHFFDALTWDKHILSIRRIRTNRLVRNLVRWVSSSPVRAVFGLFSPDAKKQLKRLNGLIKYGMKDSQKHVLDTLSGCYENEYRLVMLTMDMECLMNNVDQPDDPHLDFLHQLKELADIKRDPAYHHKIFPFVFADPRRKNIAELVKQHLSDKEGPFQGIKLYPALGYYPFDARLKDIYQLAVQFNVPVITHCIEGDVYCREKPTHDGMLPHPVAGYDTLHGGEFKKPSKYQANFSHPLNYECLLNPEHARRVFGEGVDFSKLKICLAHGGGGAEWELHLSQEQKKEKQPGTSGLFQGHPLALDQPWLGEKDKRKNWLSVILALMDKYPNVYMDISYTLHDDAIYELLSRLLADDRYKDRILFGTDYYVVATEKEEPELIRLLKSKLDDQMLHRICYENPLRFLSSELNPIEG